VTVALQTSELDHWQLVQCSAKLFGKLNGGWRWSRWGFSLVHLSLAKPSRRREVYDLKPSDVFDHLFFYKLGRVPICLISQPYRRHIDVAQRIANLHGLEILEPPQPRSGWWFPGRTHCFAFVRPGTAITWLPEQTEDHDGSPGRSA
jgi:hypothetical protein